MDVEKQRVYLEKEFAYNGVVISRWEYEGMPCSMCALGVDDDTMQEIAKDTYEYLISKGWEDSHIKKYLGENTHVLEDEEGSEGDAIKCDYWRYMEQAAIEHGMQYYEDMNEEEYKLCRLRTNPRRLERSENC